MVVYTGIVSLPPSKNVPTFNNTNYTAGQQGLTYGDALKSFLAFPQAQGKEQMLDTDVAGALQVFGDVSIVGTGNYLQFPDNTQQFTAVDPTDYATLNDSNTFLSLNSPTAPYQQIITGNNLSGNTNAPLVVKNIDTGEYFGWYIDPSSNFDTTLYSNQTNGGLTIRNVDGNSFSVAPTAPNNTAYFSNPISCGTNALNAGAITGTQLTLSSSGNSTALTTGVIGLSINDTILVGGDILLTVGANTTTISTTANGLNVSDPIVATGNITAPGFVISDGVDNIYSLYSQNGYGMVIANQNGLGTLSLSNGSTSVSTITCTAANTLDFNGASIALNGIGCQAISCSTLNTNGNLLTCGSINTGAISGSQLTLTSGANTTNLTTTSTGLTCNDSITIPAQTYPLASSNIASTISYVNQAIASQGSGDVTQSGNNAFTGTNSFSQVPTTSVTQTAFNTTSTQLASIGYATSFVYNNTQSVPLGPISILLQGGNYYTYSNSYYQTGVIGKSVFSLSTSGRATFSFSAQPNPQNSYSNNNAYLQLLSPSWSGNVSGDASSISNGAQNPILLGIWNSISSIGKFSWPFNPTTLSQLNQYGQTFVSNVLYYPTNTTYTQVYRAYVSVFTANDNSQNVALYVYPPFNGIGAQLAVQICPFTFSFG